MKVFGTIGLILITLCFVNWVCFCPRIGRFSRWFAWYPIYINGNKFWFKFVERRKEFSGSSSETCNDYIVYREIK